MGNSTGGVEQSQSEAQQWPGHKLIGTREVLLEFSLEGAKEAGFSNGKGNRIPHLWLFLMHVFVTLVQI